MRWLAIEAIETAIFSEKSDVWAFGVLIWEVLSYGELPFQEVTNMDMQRHVLGGGRLKEPAKCPSDLFKVAQLCWKIPAADRPNFSFVNSQLKSLEVTAKSCSPEERDIGALASKKDKDAGDAKALDTAPNTVTAPQ